MSPRCVLGEVFRVCSMRKPRGRPSLASGHLRVLSGKAGGSGKREGGLYLAYHTHNSDSDKWQILDDNG